MDIEPLTLAADGPEPPPSLQLLSAFPSHHRTQGEAIDAAKPIAQHQRSDVVIHGEDGRIRDRDSYGNDPYPPRDRKH